MCGPLCMPLNNVCGHALNIHATIFADCRGEYKEIKQMTAVPWD